MRNLYKLVGDFETKWVAEEDRWTSKTTVGELTITATGRTRKETLNFLLKAIDIELDKIKNAPSTYQR